MKMLIKPVLLLLSLVCPIVCWGAVDASDQSHTRILVLNSYHDGYFWSDNIMAGLRSVFDDDPTLDIIVEYLDSKRHVDEVYFQAYRDFLKVKYQACPIDLVLTTDDNALNFMLSHRAALFPDVPLVVCGIDKILPEKIQGQTRLWGIEENLDVQGTLDLALLLQPEARDVYLITDSTSSGASYLAKARDLEEAYASQLEFHFLADLPLAGLTRKLAIVPPDAIVIYLIYIRDLDGRVFTLKESMMHVVDVSQAPVYCTWGFRPELGIVGGDVASGRKQGQISAEVALKVLQSSDQTSIPQIQAAPHVPVLDYQAMVEHGMSVESAPPTCTILNQPLSFYEDNKSLIWRTLLTFGLLLMASLGVGYGLVNRRHAAQLVSSEERYRNLFDNALVGLFRTRISDGTFISVNAKAAELLCMPVEDIIGKLRAVDLYRDPQQRKDLLSVLETEGAHGFEVDLKLPNGKDIVVDFSLRSYPELGYLEGVAVDITDRKQAQEKLLRETTFSDAAIASLPGIFYVFDSQGRFLRWNDNLKTVTGYTDDEIQELRADEFFPEVERPTINKAIALVFEKGWSSVEGSFLDKDGAMTPYLMTGARFVKDGETCLAGMGLDISALKNAQTEQDKLAAQLRQSQKMEAVGQLAGGVAHDFNNLLQAILGYGDLALSLTPQTGETREYTEEIMKAGHRAQTLVSQLLAFSRRQVLRLEDLDLNESIEDLMKMMRRIIGAHIDLERVAGPVLGNVRADRGQIAQILTNLCVNARDAMPEGGTITIETRNAELDEAFCAPRAWAEPGSYVVLSVTDTGCGIDEQTLGQIFEPFFTTKRMGDGTGLGLSTVYGLVKQHGGLVHVDSQPGQGTTFKIYLPRVERTSAQESEEVEACEPTGVETILLVEDDESVLRLCREMLQRAGYTVLTAADGQDALRVFDEYAQSIDLALLDVVMPGLGGRGVFDHIRQSHPNLPVLFASGYSLDAIHTNFILDEGLTLLQKPYKRSDLLKQIRHSLDK